MPKKITTYKFDNIENECTILSELYKTIKRGRFDISFASPLSGYIDILDDCSDRYRAERICESNGGRKVW